MKRTGRCPKCDGTRIGVITEVRDEAQGVRRRHLGSTTWRGMMLSESHPIGEVEAYVCTECGYFEEHVARVSEIPWEKVDGFSWRPQPPAPFR